MISVIGCKLIISVIDEWLMKRVIDLGTVPAASLSNRIITSAPKILFQFTVYLGFVQFQKPGFSYLSFCIPELKGVLIQFHGFRFLN